MMKEAKPLAESELEQQWVEEVGEDSSKCETILSLANTSSFLGLCHRAYGVIHISSALSFLLLILPFSFFHCLNKIKNFIHLA